MSQQQSSARLQIVIAVIGLLGVLGAALIGNWDKIFPPGSQAVVSPSPSPGAPAAKPLQVRVKAPNTNTERGTVPISVEVLTGPDNPVAGAQVRIDVGGGSFRKSGQRISEGYTNPHGFFADRWTSPAGSAGITYLVTVSVSKSGFEAVSRRIEIRVRETSSGPPAGPTSEPDAPPERSVSTAPWQDQESYAGDCRARPAGTVCLRYKDGYVWLIRGGVSGWETRVEGARTIQAAVASNGRYEHILGTRKVRRVR